VPKDNKNNPYLAPTARKSWILRVPFARRLQRLIRRYIDKVGTLYGHYWRRFIVCGICRPKGRIIMQQAHTKAAEHHEQAAKAHRTAAQQHGSNDHVSAKQQSAQAAEKSKAAHDHSTQANNKSQQQK